MELPLHFLTNLISCLEMVAEELENLGAEENVSCIKEHVEIMDKCVTDYIDSCVVRSLGLKEKSDE